MYNWEQHVCIKNTGFTFYQAHESRMTMTTIDVVQWEWSEHLFHVRLSKTDFSLSMSLEELKNAFNATILTEDDGLNIQYTDSIVCIECKMFKKYFIDIWC